MTCGGGACAVLLDDPTLPGNGTVNNVDTCAVLLDSRLITLALPLPIECLTRVGI